MDIAAFFAAATLMRCAYFFCRAAKAIPEFGAENKRLLACAPPKPIRRSPLVYSSPRSYNARARDVLRRDATTSLWLVQVDTGSRSGFQPKAMGNENTFRIGLLVVLVLRGVIALHYLRPAKAAGLLLSRREEGVFLSAALGLPCLAYCVGTVVYLIEPEWMAWSSTGITPWVRWIGFVPLVVGGVSDTLGGSSLAGKLRPQHCNQKAPHSGQDWPLSLRAAPAIQCRSR